MHNKCSKCNTLNIDIAKFCNNCGKSLHGNKKEDEKLLSEGSLLMGRYTVKELLKTGGMGSIYKIRDRHLNKLCAMKELSFYRINSKKEKEYFIKRFESEAMLLSTLHHKNLPRVTDLFTINEFYYLIMDFIEGEDLDSIVQRKGSPGLPEKEVIKWGIEICDVLEYLHDRNPPVIYRDLKPANLMLNNIDKKLFLIDFGIAYDTQEEGPDAPRTRIGTMGYMAPEQYVGKPSPQSDLYSLGATLYHLLTGSIPVPFMYKPMNTIVPDISEHLEEIISCALSLQGEKRFSTAKDMKSSLSEGIETNKVTQDNTYKEILTKNERLLEELEKNKNHINILENKLKKALSGNPFPGKFSYYKPVKLIKFLLDSDMTGKVSFYSDKMKGELNVKDGNIIHVNYNNWIGEIGLAKFLNITDGDFDFNPNSYCPAPSINYRSKDLLKNIEQKKTEELLELEKIADTLISPDIPVEINKLFLEKGKHIKFKKYHMKLISLISRGKDTINKIADITNSSQKKVAEMIFYLVKSEPPVLSVKNIE